MTTTIMLMVSIIIQFLFSMPKDMVPGMCLVILLIFLDYSKYSSEYMYLDDYSMSMIILSSFIIVVMTMFITVNMSMKIILLTLMIIIMFFSSSSLLMMFIMFEFSLLPMMVLITMFGNQPERISAVRYMMMYTTLTSIPLFMIIMMLMGRGYMFIMLEQYHMGCMVESLIMLGMLSAFLVKIPMYLVHTWLPKAHVEAPVEGSMILAGIMLKMGVFGVMRMTSMFFFSSFMKDLMISLFLLGSILSCWISISVDDMKMNVAFSSVGHMNFMMSGLTICKIVSIKCSILIMISHGLCSSLLFFLITVFYYKTKSRSFIISKGSLSHYPSMVMIMFMSWVVNLACPPSISFVGEVLCMTSIMSYSVYLLPMIFTYVGMNSFFSTFSYGVMCHSNSKIQFKSCGKQTSLMVILTFFSLIFPLLMIYIALEMII